MPRARSRSKSGPAEPEGPSKAWLDSYADAMTLLLAFFILLYASSIIDEDLFIEFKVGVADALGNPRPAIDGGIGLLDTGDGVTSLIAAPATVVDGGSEDDSAPIDITGDPVEAPPNDELDLTEVTEATRENAKDIVEALEERIAEVGAAQYVDVVDDPRGVILRFDSQVLFRSGEAKILPDGVIILATVSEIISNLDNLLVIEGHTDNVPTTGRKWPSNWELSTTRATTVLRVLLDVEGIPAVRMSATGYADTRPRATNNTPEGRSENRRVEIVIVIQPNFEELISADGSSDIPRASDFGAEVDNPAAPGVFPDTLLDLDPAPAGDKG